MFCCITRLPGNEGSMTKKQPLEQLGSDLPAGLAQPARRALANAGYLRLEQLARLSENDIKKLHGIGPNALAQLRRAMAEIGLSFADSKQV
jgi:DNA-directed RNA polymerase alpha subunit